MFSASSNYQLSLLTDMKFLIWPIFCLRLLANPITSCCNGLHTKQFWWYSSGIEWHFSPIYVKKMNSLIFNKRDIIYKKNTVWGRRFNTSKRAIAWGSYTNCVKWSNAIQTILSHILQRRYERMEPNHWFIDGLLLHLL